MTVDRAQLPLDPASVQQLSPAALAYLGDAVFELYIRAAYLLPPQRLQRYHDRVVAQVRAETQSAHLKLLEPHLTSTELDIVRRGRNAASSRSNRRDAETYQRASSLETLVGYLYLCDPQRLAQLLAHLPFDSSVEP
ncbi:Mini-ribonuclease 3 [Microcoleus sp. FACHB-1515]|uniref:Mini-ribonuclease 3 n=1 Tax=Microcoleus sp. FACHB-1515 TaxID=2692821 RepID=UPI001F5577EA|nr:ribonuclease III domain-containing protein [Microcoleus sp. FACHB-1515]